MDPSKQLKQKTYRFLWLITGICTLILLAATIALTVKSKTSSGVGITGYVTSTTPTIIMRSEPNANGLIITILERGNEVIVINAESQDNITWLEIETKEFTGWIPANNVTYEPH